ncbi:MAG: hypothetical protein RQ752_07030 [Thermohalobaculum sp.]|nr:hypothetical protein [Thermohalobaculum sp.]
MIRAATVLLAALVALMPLAGAAENGDYYYPPIGSEEKFERDIAGAPPAERSVRVNFITQITKAQLEAPENPRFAIFAKGSEAEHMIIVALDDQIFATLYRARAVMAQLTANARATDFFQRANLATSATWFDLAKLLGFNDIVISDGKVWSHRIVLK